VAHPFIPVPNTCLIEMVYSANGQIVENTFHVQKGSPFTGPQLNSLCDSFASWDTANWRANRVAGAVLTNIKGRALDAAIAPIGQATIAAGLPHVGIAGGVQQPNNVTFALKLLTGLAGRSTRGRIYAVGMSASSVTAGTNDITAALANNMVTALNTLITNITALGYQLVVTSYRTGGAWRTTGVNYVITIAAYSDLHIDSQRRRLTGRGL
jgi:hypothetical protein